MHWCVQPGEGLILFELQLWSRQVFPYEGMAVRSEWPGQETICPTMTCFDDEELYMMAQSVDAHGFGAGINFMNTLCTNNLSECAILELIHLLSECAMIEPIDSVVGQANIVILSPHIFYLDCNLMHSRNLTMIAWPPAFLRWTARCRWLLQLISGLQGSREYKACTQPPYMQGFGGDNARVQERDICFRLMMTNDDQDRRHSHLQQWQHPAPSLLASLSCPRAAGKQIVSVSQQ